MMQVLGQIYATLAIFSIYHTEFALNIYKIGVLPKAMNAEKFGNQWETWLNF